MQDSQEEKQI